MKLIKTLLLMLIVFPLVAAAAPIAGQQFEFITPEQPTVSGEKIEVTEFFSYACPHCHHFEVPLQQWLKTNGAKIKFVQVPVIFRDEWRLFARAFYTADALGVIDKVHGPLFEAIHNFKRPFKTEADLAKFFAEQGIKQQDFKKAYASFAVDAKLRRSEEMTRRYSVNETPTLIVNGKYRVNGGLPAYRNLSANEAFKAIFQTVDALLAQGS